MPGQEVMELDAFDVRHSRYNWFSGVSARDKFSLMDTLMPALAERRITTIFVEHDLEIIERYAKRAVAFDGGKIIADGPVADLNSTTSRNGTEP